MSAGKPTAGLYKHQLAGLRFMMKARGLEVLVLDEGHYIRGRHMRNLFPRLRGVLPEPEDERAAERAQWEKEHFVSKRDVHGVRVHWAERGEPKEFGGTAEQAAHAEHIGSVVRVTVYNTDAHGLKLSIVRIVAFNMKNVDHVDEFTKEIDT